MTTLDLASVVAALSSAGLVFSAAFMYFGFRDNWASGMRWWALNSLVCAVGPLVITVWPVSLNSPGFWLGSLMMHLNSFFNCAGVNAHFGRRAPWHIAFLMLLFVVLPIPFVWNSPSHEFLMGFVSFYLVSVVFTSGYMYRAMTRLQREKGGKDLNLARWIAASDLMIVVILQAYLWFPEPLPMQSPTWFYGLCILFLVSMWARMCSYFSTYVESLRAAVKDERMAFQAKSDELQALIQNLGAGVVVVAGADARVALINEAGRNFFAGLGLSEVAGKLPLDRWKLWSSDGELVGAKDTFFKRPLAPGEVVRDHVLGMASEGEEPMRWGLFGAYATQADGADAQALVVTVVDITALRLAQLHEKELQQRLAESSRMRSLGTLAGGVAHDFNNLLTAILGHLHLLRDGLGAPPARDVSAIGYEEWLADQRISADAIQVAARRGRELVRQVVTFGRQIPSQLPVCDPVQVLSETMMLLRAGLPPEVKLEVRIEEPIPPIAGDGNQLSQVWLNLGSNAWQALLPGGGHVEVVLDCLPADAEQVPAELAQRCREVNGRAVRIRVIDNGAGMDPQTMSHIFEPFFTTKPPGQGTGLGLAVVYGIVQAHRGVIEVNSSPGEGSCFTVWLTGLPGASLPSAEPAQVQAAPAPGESLPSVLYLDDEEAVALLVQRLLRNTGHVCQAFTQPDEALRWLSDPAQQVDMLLTDFRMPQMNGMEFAEKALTVRPGLPVVVISGFVEDQLETQAMARGIRAVLHKTDNIEALSTSLTRIWRS